MTLGTLIFQLTGPVLQFALVLVFWNRRFFLQKFPAFFRYISFSVVAIVLQISLLHLGRVYFWVYWIDQLIYSVLAMFVMREVFQMVWDMKQGMRRFLVWILMAIFCAVALGWGLHRANPQDPLTAFDPACRTFRASVHMVEVILCGLAIWLVRKFTRYHLGIMLGFGVSATAQFLAFWGQFFHFGPLFKEAVIYAPLSAYIAASGTWLFTFLSKPKLKTQLDPVDVLAWLNEQERIAKEISAGLGLKWPGKNKDNGTKQCNAHA
jgi:hypothetical protein